MGNLVNKNELEVQKLSIQSSNFANVLRLFQHLLSLTAFVVCVFLIMNGLQGMVANKAESLNSLALVIEKLQINAILAYVVAIGTSLGWISERRGKQRAYKELGGKRAEAEKNDPYHSSSNLDFNGQTPPK
jgi:cell division protein FtsX